MTQQTFAKAIFDNLAETPEELAFRKGDILEVVSDVIPECDGWWLCKLRGRQGICPSNRLETIRTVDSWLRADPVVDETDKSAEDVQKYDIPSVTLSMTQSFHSGIEREVSYDVPPQPQPVSTEIRPASARSPRNAIDQNANLRYDTPRSNPLLTPSSSISSLLSLSTTNSNRSSLTNMPDYDVPKSVPKKAHVNDTSSSTSTSSGRHDEEVPTPSIYDTPSCQTKTLQLDMGCALALLERHQHEATASISRLLAFVTSADWRQRDKLEPNVSDIKVAVSKLKMSLHDLTEFGEGCLSNAYGASDKNLAIKLRPLVKALHDADVLIEKSVRTLDVQDWSLNLLERSSYDGNKPSDALDHIVACCRVVTEDIRQIASFIQGNCTLLFKRDPNKTPSTPVNSESKEFLQDYAYVNFEARKLKEENREVNRMIRNASNLHITDCYNENNSNVPALNTEDREIVVFYAQQILNSFSHLTQAIDAFLYTIEHNQAPKVFLSHSKIVVLSAHRLINIGDMVHRQVTHETVARNVLNCTNALSTALATCATKTRRAAQQFPSVTAVQEMVDSVVHVSHTARDLKIAMIMT